jgi:dTDP-glucose 4,6-dehydratase
MDRVLVLGSNSFSGASFVRYLLNLGMVVKGISRSPEPTSALLPYTWDGGTSFSFHRLDLNQDLQEIMEVIRGFRPSIVVNFASQSMVAESWQHPEDWFQTNVISTIRFHDQLRHLNFVERYVHISTPEVYGGTTGSVTEGAPLNPTTPYAVSRAACDMSLVTFFKAYNFPVVFTRAANVYGPGQQVYRIIPRTILAVLSGKRLPLHGGGASVRSFIHIRDVADCTWRVAKQGRLGEVYHISTPHTVSIKSLVEMICKKLNASFESLVDIVGDRLGKDSAYILDSQKARAELGWRESIDLESGIDETISWARSNMKELMSQPPEYIHKK